MRREQAWRELNRSWDVIVVGGGVTGAAVFYEAAQLGLCVLLLEQKDFAWGASSRSGKLVHGGLRYLRQAQFDLTWHAAREREVLLRETPGLVRDLGFLFPVYRRRERLLLGVGLALYDLMTWGWHHRYLDANAFLWLSPHVRREGLKGGFCYREAETDDARLVLRLIAEGRRAGGVALNYTRVETLLRTRQGAVVGVAVRDDVTGRTVEVRARVVVNATGFWADRLRTLLGGENRLRPLRGSHLLFPHWRFPLAQAVGFWHPVDHRPLYALPWEGVTLVGTTDVDHDQDPDAEPRPTAREIDYLLTALRYQFPLLDLNESDVLATFAGVRPVVGKGKRDPSKEPREHVVWSEQGLVTVTGGKLTTFRVLAHDALRAIAKALGTHLPRRKRSGHALWSLPRDAAPPQEDLEPAVWLRLVGRYGPDAHRLLEEALPEERQPIGDTPYLRAEVRWAAAREDVVHLDDLLLRRVRLGLVTPRGGLPLLGPLRPLIQASLHWDDARWEQEVARYTALWRRAYSNIG